MPYPDYNEIMHERERKLRQEQEGGRQRVMKDMALGLMERVMKDMRCAAHAVLNASDGDPRKWTVTITVKDVPYTENFWVFPSDEFKATYMMLTGN